MSVGRSTAIGAIRSPMMETNQNFFLKGSVNLMTRLKIGNNGSFGSVDICSPNKLYKLKVGDYVKILLQNDKMASNISSKRQSGRYFLKNAVFWALVRRLM